MKKVWLITAIIGIVALVVAGNVLFQHKNEETSQQALAEARELDEEETNEEEGSVAEEKSSSTESGVSETDDAEEGKEEVVASSSTTSGSSSSTKQTTSTGATKDSDRNQSSAGTETESVISIKNRYFSDFQQLEFQQNGKLEALIGQAIHDHSNGKLNTAAIRKYQSEAKALEGQADAAFYQKYAEVQAELVANGHSKEAAAEFAQTYESKKASREQELRGFLSNQ